MGLEFPIPPHHRIDAPSQEGNPKGIRDVGWECHEFPSFRGISWSQPLGGSGLAWDGFSMDFVAARWEFPARDTHQAALAPQHLRLVQVPHGALCREGKEKIPFISQEFQGKHPNPPFCSRGLGSKPQQGIFGGSNPISSSHFWRIPRG